MLFLLSPAKSLDYETPLGDQPHTLPMFVPQSKELIAVLRTQSPQQIAELMSLSDKLSALNVARYLAWSPKATPKNARQAVLAFNGDVYDGLNAKTLTPDDLAWAQDHVCILSGLYGVLRPLDLMQPYRLEMGTRLSNPGGKDLYQFWGTQIADYLNTRLRSDVSPVVINLASQEYFKAVDTKALKARVVECVFQDYSAGQYKIVSFFAKRARGLMARYAATHR
ncbi:MAG TPA: peroxide stress protein YaaA, partial [Rhodoferax sp.]|nr:peroxide stress protein YaaA [Rhodoferax sp.]